MPTIIDQQYESGNTLVDYLKSQQQLTFYNEAENNFRKTILLSAASFFEKEISETVIEFAKSHTGNNELVISIIKQKAVSRQYHTYFNWESANARSEEHTSELQSRPHLVCRLLLEKKN